jgi:autotransporter family porin
VSWGTGRYDVFVTGTDAQLWHRRWEAGRGWSGWQPLGGRLTSGPTATSWGPGRIDVAARGTDGSVVRRWYDHGAWVGPTPPTGERFVTLPPGSTLPSDSDCAARVRPAAEVRRNQNAVPNRFGVVPNQTRGAAGVWDDGDPAKAPFTARVTGNFTGTTDEIIQWAACKWGIDEDIARAQVAKESWWDQANSLGDRGSDPSRCDPRFPRGTVGTDQCPESYGLMQDRYPYMRSAFPLAYDSTAFNLDVAFAIWRSCFEGTETWLNTVERGHDYGAGDVWGCVGRWFSGRWYTEPAVAYIEAVQDYLNRRIWTTSDFIAYGGA